MGTRYRVIVEQVDDVEGAQYETRETVLFETVSPNLVSLLRFAPAEVDAALRTALDDAEPWDLDRAAATVPVVPVGELRAAVFNAAGDEISAAPQAPVGAEPVDEPAPTKRKRRTKSEIAADKAREAAEATGAQAEPVETTSIVDPFARTEAPPVTVEQDLDGITAEQLGSAPAPVVEPAPPAAPEPAAAAPAAPYNPFV